MMRICIGCGLLDEVFGVHNFIVSMIPFENNWRDEVHLIDNDYLLWFAKDRAKYEVQEDLWIRRKLVAKRCKLHSIDISERTNGAMK